MDNKKKYTFDLNATLISLKQGESVSLAISGKKRETTLQAVYQARKRNGLALSIKQNDDHTSVLITAL